MTNRIVVQAAGDASELTGRNSTAPTASTSTIPTDLDAIRFNNLTDNPTEGKIYAGLERTGGYYDYKLRSIVAGEGLTVSATPSSIVISLKSNEDVVPPVQGGLNENNTGGLIFKGVDGDQYMRFRNIVTDEYLTLTQTPNTLTIGLATPPTGGDVSGGNNLGTPGFSLYKNKTGGNLNFRKLVSASPSLLLSYNAADEAVVLGLNEATINVGNTLGNLPASRVTGLAPVATSGSYNALTNKPTIPLQLKDLNDYSGTATTDQILAFNGTGWSPKSIVIPAAQNTFGTITHNGDNILANTPNTVLKMVGAGGVSIAFDTANREITYGLTPTGVTPGAYGYASISVDQYGRVTGIQGNNNPSEFVDPTIAAGDMIFRNASNAVTRLPVGTGGQVLLVENGVPAWRPIPASQTVVNSGDGITVTTKNNVALVSLASNGVTVGTYTAPTMAVDKYGRIVNITSNSYIPATRKIDSGAGLQGGGDLSIDRTISLQQTGVVAGVYTNPELTVDQFGRITRAASSGSGIVSSIGINGMDDLRVFNTPVTSAGIIRIELNPTAVTPGVYNNARITVDQKGRITDAKESTSFFIDDETVVIDPAGAIHLRSYPLADIMNKASEVNTTYKAPGKMILDITSPRVLVSLGMEATDGWITTDGTTTVIPV